MKALINSQEYTIRQEDYRISKEYTANQTPEADYAAILIDRGDPLSTGGFGFNLRLGEVETLRGDLNVTGFRAGNDASDGTASDRASVVSKGSSIASSYFSATSGPKPITSSGSRVICYREQLEYRIKTEPGISGSAVWVGYEGRPTVVAIHNHGSAAGNRGGSRGSRLTSKLLREVLSWVNVIKTNVRLRVHARKPQESPMLKQGLYLNFSAGFQFARVKLGTGTTFDVLPANVLAHLPPDASTVKYGEDYDPPESEKTLYSYALAMRGQSGSMWVTFNAAKKEVALSEKLGDNCLFRKGGKLLKKGVLRVVVHKNASETFQLRISNERIRDFDKEYAESSEVSFIEHPKGDKALFTEFKFEPVPDIA